jgi:uncharacterized coiled-coil protein SlyX
MMKPTYQELEFQVTSQRMALEAAAKKLGQLVENFGAGMVFEELIGRPRSRPRLVPHSIPRSAALR